MKRLLAYLFIVLGLGLTFNVNANAVSGKGLCINGLTNGVNTPLVTKSKNLGLCSEKEFLLKRKYPTQYRLLKKKVGNFKTSKQISLIEILYIINDTHIYDEYTKDKKVAESIIEKKKKNTKTKNIKVSLASKNGNELYLLPKEYSWLGKKVSKKEFEKLNKEKLSKSKFKETGFNVFDGPVFSGKNSFPHVEAYFENNCMKHGLVQYMNGVTKKSYLDVFGIFNDCMVLDPLSKVARISYENGEMIGMDLFKKDVSHLYGNKPIIGVSTNNTINQNGIIINNIMQGKPISKTNIKKGDIILSVNGVKIKSVLQFAQLIKETAENISINIEFIAKEFLDINQNFNIINVQRLDVKPEFLKRKAGLHVGYNVRLDLYFEGLSLSNSMPERLMDEVALNKGTEAFNDRQSILKQEFLLLKKYYDSLRKIKGPEVIKFDHNKLYIVSNKKVYNKTTLTENQNEFVVNKSKDINPPIITVEKNITVNNANYQISGKVEDDTSKKIYVEVDGIIENTTNGNFTIKRFSPVNETISIVAIDKWGNRSKPISINVKIDIKKTILIKKIERLNPSIIKKQSKPNRVALIIGIENYSRTPKASYANLDAKFFYEYAKNNFGIKGENINY